jgi:hypothetical protein
MSNWERDVRAYKALGGGPQKTPYEEVRMWKRRFYMAFAVMLFALLVLAGMIGGCR